MSAHVPVPVADGLELYVPRSEFERRVIEQAQEMARADSFVGYGHGFGTTFYGMGSQPADRLLLGGTKGWAAIAATAVARRIRGLNVQVGMEIQGESGQAEFVPLDDHILRGILAMPNPIFDGRSLLWLTALHLQQVGEAYWQRVDDSMGVTRELWPLPPQNVEMQVSREGLPIYRVHGADGRTHALMPEEVVHFWEPDPETLITAMGRLGPVWTEFLTSRYLAQHQEKHYQHDAVPRVVMEAGTDAAPIEDKHKRAFLDGFRNDFNQRTGNRVGEVAFMPSGWSAKELRGDGGIDTTVQVSDAAKEQILSAYGVPGSIVGMVQDVNRAAAETNRYTFDVNTVEPMTVLMSDAMTLQLAIDYDPALRVRFAPFVEADKEFVLRQEDQDARNAVRSVQQIRADRGLDPEGASWGELPIQSLAMVPYSGEESFLEDPNDLRGSQRDGRMDSSRCHRHPSSAARASGSSTRVDQTDDRAMQREARRIERKYVPPLMRAVQRHFAITAQALADAIRRNPPPDTGSTGGGDEGGRMLVGKRLEAEWLAEMESAAGDRPFRVDGEIYRILDDTWRESGFVTLDSLVEVPPPTTLSSMSELAGQRVAAQTIRLAGNVSQATRRQVTEALREGITAGEGVNELIARIQQRGTFSRKRARTIARTEVGGAHLEAQLAGRKASGRVDGQQWFTSMDESRDDHIAMHGQVQALGMPFILPNGERAFTPRQISLSPGQRVNCQCVSLAVIGGET